MKCHQSLGCDLWEPRYLERWQEAYPAFDGLIRWGPGAVGVKLPESLGWTGGGLKMDSHVFVTTKTIDTWDVWKLWKPIHQLKRKDVTQSGWMECGELMWLYVKKSRWTSEAWKGWALEADHLAFLTIRTHRRMSGGIGSGNRMLSSPTCVDFWVAKINPCYQCTSDQARPVKLEVLPIDSEKLCHSADLCCCKLNMVSTLWL